MKLIKLLILIILTACGVEENNVPETTLRDMAPSSDSSSLVSSAIFASRGGYSVSGEAQLFYDSVTDNYSLILDNFSSSNGPDVHVYLSTDSAASSFTDLGDLKATSGTIRYDFSAAGYNINEMNVLIWCKAIDEAFGEAML